MAEKKGSMIFKVTVGFVLGIAFGFFVGPYLTADNTGSKFGEAIVTYVIPALDMIGKIFLKLLRMLIVPLVLSSLVVGAASLGDLKSVGRIGAKTVFWYLFTTAVAIAIGLALSHYVVPGSGLSIAGVTAEAREGKPLMDVFLDIFPENPFGDIGSGNMLKIIVFALFLGVSATLAGEKAKPFVDFANGFAETMYGMTEIVLKFAPYGVFALIAKTAAEYGIDILMPFAKVIGCVYLGCVIHALVVYGGIITLFARRSPFWFFRGALESSLTAFVTRSSSGTLPVTIENARVNLGIPTNIASFVLPLGATINMDGTALYQGVCAIFVAQAFGIELTMAQYGTVILTATLASIGTAGVPGAGLIMLTLVLTAVGLPIEGAGLVAGIDVVLDMARTSLNVTGDNAVACVVTASEGGFERTDY
ncbi:MAG: dicarboxylate/amino acid:cation symporter [Synergistaceae bacterium]|nr:dicarboxylate/amino acid:cation symporter [Synergistaceae bacterium]